VHTTNTWAVGLAMDVDGNAFALMEVVESDETRGGR
jgi:hypothetical protein